MGVITYAFVALAFISALSCAPVNEDSTAKPPAVAASTTTTTPVPQHYSEAVKRDSSKDISSEEEESKESAESKEHKKRPARDSQSSGSITQQTKDLPSGGVIKTPPPVTKDAPQPQLPAREARDTHEYTPIPAGVFSAQRGVTTSSTPASTTARRP